MSDQYDYEDQEETDELDEFVEAGETGQPQQQALGYVTLVTASGADRQIELLTEEELRSGITVAQLMARARVSYDTSFQFWLGANQVSLNDRVNVGEQLTAVASSKGG